MKIEIKDNADLLDQLQIANMKLGETIQALCIELFAQGHNLNEKTVLIKIATDLVAGSYIGNPAMFAHTMKDKVQYPNLQSYLADGYLMVRAGEKKKATTFRAQVREALETASSFTVQRTKVPVSYRRRPSLLSAVLTEDLGQEVCNQSKGSRRIRWYLKD